MPIEGFFKKEPNRNQLLYQRCKRRDRTVPDKGLLTSTFYNFIIIIFLTVAVEYFQKYFAVECVCDAMSIFIILNLFINISSYGLKTTCLISYNLQQC